MYFPAKWVVVKSGCISANVEATAGHKVAGKSYESWETGRVGGRPACLWSGEARVEGCRPPFRTHLSLLTLEIKSRFLSSLSSRRRFFGASFLEIVSGGGGAGWGCSTAL